jgi:thiol-disulfide isomerase/thioredoxin
LGLSVIGSVLSEGNIMRLFLSAVLYTALALGANPGRAADLNALRLGDMEKLILSSDAPPLPDVAFTGEDGSERRLADYSGKVILVNFWATWCAPCREEMPALQALQDSLGGNDFAVVTIATGRAAPAAIDRFFAEAGVTTLPRHTDPRMELSRAAGVLGLPVTILVGRDGREIGRLLGGADWTAPEAQALIAAAIADRG